MKAQLERIMARYGQTAALVPRDGGVTREVRAFIQPVLKEQAEPPVAVTPLGPVSEHRWLYIGPSGVPVMPGDRITFDKTRLIVQEARPVYWRNSVLYHRAVLRREKEAAI